MNHLVKPSLTQSLSFPAPKIMNIPMLEARLNAMLFSQRFESSYQEILPVDLCLCLIFLLTIPDLEIACCFSGN